MCVRVGGGAAGLSAPAGAGAAGPNASTEAAAAGEPATAKIELPFDDLAEAIARGFTIIDVREPHETAQSPAPARPVREIPLHALLERILREPAVGERTLDPRAKYLLVCASGKRSLAAAQELRARGFAEAYSLPGGLAGLKQRLPA